ncbi:hypothetical protein, partial [Flavonifractor plautii]|uniref:hypothetical protein n=1 Tax=Flavonifractor plautii TaxID=292800 RepID=UPI001D06BAC6
LHSCQSLQTKVRKNLDTTTKKQTQTQRYQQFLGVQVAFCQKLFSRPPVAKMIGQQTLPYALSGAIEDIFTAHLSVIFLNLRSIFF